MQRPLKIKVIKIYMDMMKLTNLYFQQQERLVEDGFQCFVYFIIVTIWKLFIKQYKN